MNLQLRRALQIAVGLLFVRVLASTLWEYRWYFPADFQSAFLTGRESTFYGLYELAFYAHIISSPVALVLAGGLVVSGRQFFQPNVVLGRLRKLHRWGGRIQTFVVLGLVVPSGLAMSPGSRAGLPAVVGFLTLSSLTALTIIMAARAAISGRYADHRRWAMRCFLLLCSSLLLRVLGGAFIVLNVESRFTYQLNSWISWLVPLVIYECMILVQCRRNRRCLSPTSPPETLSLPL
ncbi:hypothetical protein Pla22_30230 [Rubripirellula amarantea]|uniref:DUF2306 domain-containing protein n=1 Tax=Rubripirellula amarantea TaxID=2527999 RepID=A0A5C5WKA2_9BACT|nr:DUF2306 domain-containing protein [Rubripirellula amarantea]TWT50282.1 hypothetical protein Pla22_30230 [Rubripirellula amarantea]